MATKRLFPLAVATAMLLLLGACGEQDAESVASEEPAIKSQATPDQPAALRRTDSPESASVYFITPADGDTVQNPVAIEFGLDGMSVVAAGINEEHSGHHHLLVDTELPEMGAPIPADENHIHFGDASTSTELTLAPGQHTLRLLLGDHLHIPHDPPIISKSITITVE